MLRTFLARSRLFKKDGCTSKEVFYYICKLVKILFRISAISVTESKQNLIITKLISLEIILYYLNKLRLKKPFKSKTLHNIAAKLSV